MSNNNYNRFNHDVETFQPTVRTPEQNLIIAILYRAVADLGTLDSFIQRQAISYISSKSRRRWGFWWCAKQVNLEVGAFIRKVREVDALYKTPQEIRLALGVGALTDTRLKIRDQRFYVECFKRATPFKLGVFRGEVIEETMETRPVLLAGTGDSRLQKIG